MNAGSLIIPAAPMMSLDFNTGRSEKEILEDAGFDYRDFLATQPIVYAYQKRNHTQPKREKKNE